MRFLMVDRIYDLQKGRSARGIKNISLEDGFIDEVLPGVPVFSPVIAAEAAAQLVSWVIIEARDFTVKPVITMVDRFVCSGRIMPGDRLELYGEIESLNQDSALAHGKVSVNGNVVVELSHAVCYLYPLEELDPPERARIQFNNLYDEGFTLPPIPDINDSYTVSGGGNAGNGSGMPDIVFSTGDPDCLRAVKNVTSSMDFFNDHFPLKPVLPGVVLIRCMSAVAEMLIGKRLPPGRRPVIRLVNKIKFRKFVVPGDQVVIEARIKNFSDSSSQLSVKSLLGGKIASSAVLDFDHLEDSSLKERFC